MALIIMDIRDLDLHKHYFVTCFYIPASMGKEQKELYTELLTTFIQKYHKAFLLIIHWSNQ